MLCPVVRNPSATPQGANKVSRDPSQRIQNLNFVVQQIKTYYLVSLVPHVICYITHIQPARLSFFLHQIMISEHLMWISQLQLSLTMHTLDHACSEQLFSRARVPEDEVALLKMYALNIQHVHICVIGTGARLERSREQQ